VQGLHLSHEEIALGEVGADLELVGRGAFAKDATGEVYGAEMEDGEVRSGDVTEPALGADLVPRLKGVCWCDFGGGERHTSIMRPTTRSPISGVYRARSGLTERSLLVLVTVPATLAMIFVPSGPAV
jgi:hypothetical protein